MIIREARRTSFTTISNSVILDDRLDWKELGLLCYLLSKPDNWQTHPNYLVKQRKTGRDGIYSILKKLTHCGYMRFERHSDGKTEWIVSENPYPENPKPHQEKPHQEKPHQENPDVLISTDLVVNTERDRSSADDGFDSFWTACPKKVAKKDARKAWGRMTITDRKLAKADYSSRYADANKKFIPNPATYLNGERWNDERHSSNKSINDPSFVRKNSI